MPGILHFCTRRFALCATTWLAVGCGNEEWSFGAPGRNEADAGPDADVAPDAEACGDCGEGARCKDSACECLPSRARCGAACVALVTDPEHCGACNVVCGSAQACRGGSCQ